MLLYDLRCGYLHLIFSDKKRERGGDGVSLRRWRLSHNNGAVKHQRSTPVIFTAKNYVLESCSRATAPRILRHKPLYISQIDTVRKCCALVGAAVPAATKRDNCGKPDVPKCKQGHHPHRKPKFIPPADPSSRRDSPHASGTPGIFYDRRRTDAQSFCLHLQDRRAHFCKDDSETIALIYLAMRRHIPEESKLHRHHSEKHNSHN